MNADSIPDPAAACRRVLAELDRPRWREGVIPARAAHQALCDALYGLDADGQPCGCDTGEAS